MQLGVKEKQLLRRDNMILTSSFFSLTCTEWTFQITFTVIGFKAFMKYINLSSLETKLTCHKKFLSLQTVISATSIHYAMAYITYEPTS